MNPVTALIRRLKNGKNETRISAAKTLVKIRTPEATEPLIEALEDNIFTVREHAAQALGKIGDTRAVKALLNAREAGSGSTRNIIDAAVEKIIYTAPPGDFNFLCGKCICRYKDHEIWLPLVFNAAYSACSNCRSNAYLTVGIEKVVLVLDHHFKEPGSPGEDILTVDWFARKTPCDYDEIRIIDADDFEVEELVMKLKNDMDEKRRKRMPDIPVYLSPRLNLSPAKRNLLKDNFDLRSHGR